MAQLVGQDDSTFHVDLGDGNVVPISKANIDPSLEQQILALPTPDPAGPAAAPAVPDPGVAYKAGSMLKNAVGDAAGAFKTVFGPAVTGAGNFVHGLTGSPADVAESPSPPGSTPSDPTQSLAAESRKVDPSQLAIAPQAPDNPLLKLDPMAHVKGMQAGFNAEEQGNRDLGNAQADAAKQTAGVLAQNAEAIRTAQAIQAQRRAEEDAQVTEQMNKVKSMQADVANASHLDPDRYIKNMDTIPKIIAGISIALGGLGGAMTGKGGNAALDVINSAIQRDFEAQKADLQNKRSALSDQQNLVGMFRQQFSDRRQADSAALANMYQMAQMKVQEIAAQSQAPEVQARARALGGQLKVQENQAMSQVELSARQSYALRQAQQGGQINAEALPQDARERYVPGLGLASSKAEAEKAMDYKGKIDTFNQTLSQLQDFAKQHGGTVLDREKVNFGKTLAKNAQDQYRQLQNEGVFRKGEAEFIQSIIPDDPTEYFASSRYLPQLQAAQQVTTRAAQNFYRSHGFKVGDVNFTPGK